MTTAIDLTGLDIAVRATVRGGTRRANLTAAGAPLNLTGVASFVGEILPLRTSALGTGTAITWPVVDAVGGGVSITIPTGLTVGSKWCYATATVAGSTVEISGPLTIVPF